MDSVFNDRRQVSHSSDQQWHEEDEQTRPQPRPTDPDPVPVLSAGAQLGGRFRLEQELGNPLGTMTWRAFDLKLHRPVLMHIMAPDGAHTDEVLAAARRAAVATDSRFLRVLDAVAAGPGDPGSFVVCEFAPGRSIAELLQSGPLSALEAAWIIRELADAMAPLHSLGLFHERLNPDNVIVTSTGNVKIVGLLIQAALHPWPGDQSLTWSDREARDVSDMGRLLYACLVSRWPVGTARHPRPLDSLDGRVRWGLVPAPSDDHGWLPPHQVRAGVSPALDTLCDQILSEVPRHNEVPIRTANEVTQALTRVLGSADAAADLERRLRYPAEQGNSTTAPVTSAVGAAAPGAAGRPAGSNGTPTEFGTPGADDSSRGDGYPDDDGTGSSTIPGRDEDGYWTPEAAAGEWAHVPAQHYLDGGSGDLRAVEGSASAAPGAGPRDPGSPRGSRRQAGSGSAGRPDGRPIPMASHIAPADVEKVSHQLARPRPDPRRWQIWAVGLVAAVLVVCLLLVGLRRVAATEPAGQAASSASTAVTISKVDDFDPEADGGNDEENPNKVSLAWDGKADTAWTTLVYKNSPSFGRLKPGVGLVVDLGSTTSFSSVTVTLVNGATDVALYVPRSAGAEPPMSTIGDWRRVTARQGARGATTLKPSPAVSSRYLLVYLSKLPKISDNRFQGGIAEIKVNP